MALPDGVLTCKARGILRKEGYEVKNRDFLRVGLPFTLVAVLVGYAYIWLVWA